MLENINENKNSTNPFEEKAEMPAENETETNHDTVEEKKEPAKEEKSKEEALQAELDDTKNKYLRMAADFDNYRKRQAQERESLIKYAAEDTLKKIIPVLDTFERAIKSIEKTEDIKTVKESYNVCIKQLNDVLEKIGLKKIEALGLPFDPNFMEAVMQTPTNDAETHTVLAELQTGYKLYDRVLRPVMVNVAVEGEASQNEASSNEEVENQGNE